MKNLLKYIFFGILLLFLFHFESLSIGPIKISHLWKGVLLLFVLISTLNGRNHLYFYKPLIFLAFLQLINFDLILNPKSAVVAFATTLLFAYGGAYLIRYNSIILERILLFIISTFILSFLPYKLGLLSSIGAGYNLEGYGVEIDGLIGPFQKVHSASTTLAGCLIVLTYFWFKNTFNSIYISILFVLGFYFLFYTYVRTGMLMFGVGIIPIVFHFGKQNMKYFMRVLFLVVSSFLLISTWILTNDTLMRRISGERDYYQEDSIETIGSGRVYFLISSIEIFEEENIYEKLVGIGITEQLLRMKQKIGYALFPHNGFLLLLLANGIIGLIVFLNFIRNIYKLQRIAHVEDGILLKALFIAYLIMILFQSYDIIYMFLLLSLSIAYTRSKEVEIRRIKHQNK